VGFVFLYRIGKAVTELLVGQRDGPMVVSEIREDGCSGFKLRERQRQHAAKARRVDGDGYGR
jgi:hypothetical protein